MKSELTDHGQHVAGWRRWAVPLAVVGVAVAVTACSGSSKASAPPPAVSQPASATGSGSSSGSGGGGAPPAAFGTAAAVSPGNLEVQNPTTGQTTVTYTTATVFTQTKAVTRSALAVGQCVVALAVGRAAGTASASPAAPSSPAAPPSGPVSFTAATITISQPVNGSCTTAGFGGGGARPSGSPRTFPSGSRPPGGGFGAAERAMGKITALKGSSLTVQADRRSGSTVNDTVTVAVTTAFTETGRATASALRVGECVTAVGPTNSTGAVAATRIAISNPGPNGCTQRFGRAGAGSGRGTTSSG